MSISKDDESSDDSAPQDNEFGEMKDSETMVQIALPSRSHNSIDDSSTESDNNHDTQVSVTEVSGTYTPFCEDDNATPTHSYTTPTQTALHIGAAQHTGMGKSFGSYDLIMVFKY